MTGFNGSFTFNSLTNFQITQQDLHAGFTPAQIRADCRGSSPAGTPICGGASLFAITKGNSLLQNNYADLGFYAQDERRLRSNITVNYGLRYEWQNQLNDKGGLAPRLGIAWGLGKSRQGSPKAVLRAGFCVFYDRFKQQYLEQAQLLNGITQQSFIVTSPDFYPNLPIPAQLAAAQTSPTIYQVDPGLRTHTPFSLASLSKSSLAKSRMLLLLTLIRAVCTLCSCATSTRRYPPILTRRIARSAATPIFISTFPAATSSKINSSLMEPYALASGFPFSVTTL
jgi:TonB dependent receptor